jgi:hypothetical protein
LEYNADFNKYHKECYIKAVACGNKEVIGSIILNIQKKTFVCRTKENYFEFERIFDNSCPCELLITIK